MIGLLQIDLFLAFLELLIEVSNAGEIGFDSLLISKLKERGSKINLLVKEGPFPEDVTTEDVSFFGLDQLVDSVAEVHGFFVPGESSSSLVEVFKKSDLLIAKSTGNYEALKAEFEGKRAIFMLKVKCKPIATDTGRPCGDFRRG